MSLFWHMNNAHRVSAAEAAAARGEHKALDARREVLNLTERVDRLTLACMALWSLVQEKTGLTEEDLLQRMQEIDLADGQADGKVSRQVEPCAQCGRRLSSRHRRCIYCGAERPGGGFEASL